MSPPRKYIKLLHEIESIGKVGTDIFSDAAQGICLSLTPFIDPGGMETAKHCNLGSTVDAICDAVGEDAVECAN